MFSAPEVSSFLAFVAMLFAPALLSAFVSARLSKDAWESARRAALYNVLLTPLTICGVAARSKFGPMFALLVAGCWIVPVSVFVGGYCGAAAFSLKARRAAKRGDVMAPRCPACNDNLTANNTGRCPECGRTLEREINPPIAKSAPASADALGGRDSVS